ncbi:MAG: replication-relaxation family protein [Solirubrobacteraceae bacterium]
MRGRADPRWLPAVSAAILESLYQHLLLSSGQIHRMHTPTASASWSSRTLTTLRRHGLVSFQRATGDGSVYFLTEEGARAVERIAARTLARRKPISAKHAAGPLRAHTLAVNDTGIAFMQAARQRGDDFGPLAWQHEVAHPVDSRRGQLLIADALLSYLRYGANGQLIFESRLLELDRATLASETLAGKLSRYAKLYRYTRAGQNTPAWRARYPIFPGVLCVLAGAPAAALQRRRDVVLALCREDPQLKTTPEIELTIGLLSDLKTEGPYAAIWRQPDKASLVNWLGESPARTEDQELGR